MLFAVKMSILVYVMIGWLGFMLSFVDGGKPNKYWPLASFGWPIGLLIVIVWGLKLLVYRSFDLLREIFVK
jgi:hypothetical protein